MKKSLVTFQNVSDGKLIPSFSWPKSFSAARPHWHFPPLKLAWHELSTIYKTLFASKAQVHSQLVLKVTG
jgi:hypothetical protein